MTDEELERLMVLEQRIKEIAEELGLTTTEIDFEIVSPQKMMEAMAYMLPVNFSHWSRGRDFERAKTIYDYQGAGLPYEVVWNFKHPRAFLMETNPFVLNVLTVAHVYGHVDFNLRNTFTSKGREIADMATEARRAVKRFEEYENKYGKERVEKVIEAGLSLQWLQNPNPLAEEADEEDLRERLLEIARAKLRKAKGLNSDMSKKASDKEIRQLETTIKRLKYKTPPEPTYDILGYIIRHSTRLEKHEWQRDILSVIRNQANSLMKQARTKLLNEGWATYWHTQIMRRLFEEGLLDHNDHEVYTRYHTAVLRENKKAFNWYRVGTNLYAYIKERWDKGQFGKDWDAETNSNKRAQWDTGAGLGTEKIFKVSENFTDRMVIEQFFTDEFIHKEKLYIYAEVPSRHGGIEDVIIENNPEIIRNILIAQHTSYGTPRISVEDGNYKNRGELYIKHHFTGFELDPKYENGALEYIYSLWGKPVHLETVESESDQGTSTEKMFTIPILHSYNGRKHTITDI